MHQHAESRNTHEGYISQIKRALSWWQTTLDRRFSLRHYNQVILLNLSANKCNQQNQLTCVIQKSEEFFVVQIHRQNVIPIMNRVNAEVWLIQWSWWCICKTAIIFCCHFKVASALTAPTSIMSCWVSVIPTSVVRDLDIYIDSDLSTCSHVSRTMSCCIAVLRQLSTIRCQGPTAVFQSLITVFVLP